jgi:hypothetical protein
VTKIFLCYRREDTSGHAGRLADRLCTRFGRDAVFRDLDSIGPGQDFTAAIPEAVGTCDAVVAVIGRNWLLAGPDGRRRLDDPDDFVRVELAAALERGVQLIPVLVDRAEMPTSQSLPPPLTPLARRNALELSESRWDHDVQRLIDELDPPSQTPGGPVPAAPNGPRVRARVMAGAGGFLVAAALVLLLNRDGGGESSSTAAPTSTSGSTASTAMPGQESTATLPGAGTAQAGTAPAAAGVIQLPVQDTSQGPTAPASPLTRSVLAQGHASLDPVEGLDMDTGRAADQDESGIDLSASAIGHQIYAMSHGTPRFAVLATQGAPDYLHCAGVAPTAWVQTVEDVYAMRTGDQICVRTDRGNLGVLTLRIVPSADVPQLDLDYITWAGA